MREVLATVWQHAEPLCGKRLAPALPLWLPHYAKHFNPLRPSQKKLLKQISPATIDRLLAECKVPTRGLGGTRPGTLLREQIPLAGEVCDQTRPGFLEVDSVAHCGGSLAGDFIWSLTSTCLGTGWTEGRAVWNKGYPGVLTQIQDVEARLPLPCAGWISTTAANGSTGNGCASSRNAPRPSGSPAPAPTTKDDNAHVEPKNWMWARQLLGDRRLENPDTPQPLNELYRDARGPRHNFFLPSTKLVAKRREGRRIVRPHDPPQTAYQRLVTSGELNRQTAAQLREPFAALDPFALAQSVNQRLKKT